MNKKALIIGTSVVGLAGLAYYAFVYRRNQSNTSAALTNIQKGIVAANTSAGRSLTLAQLQAKEWKNTAGVVVPPSYIQSFDPATGLIAHGSDSSWTGILLDPQTIAWTHRNGQTDIWKALNGLSGKSTFSGLLR